MERREVLASNLGAIAGVAFVDQANDGSEVGDPAVPQGTQIALFVDSNSNGLFDIGPDLLAGTDFADALGGYRFDGLAPGDYFLVQDTVVGLTAPPPQLVTVTNEAGIQVAAIDSYETATTPVSADSATPLSTAFTVAPEAIGGERDVQVTYTSGTSDIELEVAGDRLTVSTGAGTAGQALLQYDGTDGAISLNAVGLGGADLSAGDLNSGLEVSITGDNPGGSLTVFVYTSASDFSSVVIAIPDTLVEEQIFVAFSSFADDPGGSGADFTNVGAIEASIATVANLDISVTIIASLQPDVVTSNLANIQPVSLGGMLFSDSSSGGQNNGFREGSEPGLGGATVELYQLAGANDVVDPTGAALTSTTTGPDGTYSFNGLVPGHYAVVVPASQFLPAANLDGQVNSTGNDPANDPDDNIDSDDNGTVLPSGDVISGTITIESNSEPIDDDDTDPNTNTTIDFGFFPQVDLMVTKTLDVTASNIIAGGNAVFDIVVTNNGPNDATNVQVQDIIPSGLIFTGTQNTSGSFTTNIAGSTVTVIIGTLPNGTTATFELTASIGANQTADITNAATVTGTESDLDVTNNSEDETIDLIATDLRIEKTDLTDPVDAGTQLTYQITVTNDGPDDAIGVTVLDPLPAGVTFASGDVDGDSGLINSDPISGLVTATIGDLANGANSVITILVDVASNAGDPLTNSATVTASPNTDPDASNNISNEDTTVDRNVDVALTKTVSGTPVAGLDVTYTLDVTNSGPSEARGVTVTDTLDPNLTLVPASFNPGTSGATLTQVGQLLTFDIGNLDALAVATFSFDVTIDSSAFTTITNAATVSTTDTDSDSSNDMDSIDIVAAQQVDLIMTKDVDLSTAVPGPDQLVYTITVSHDTDSPSDATNVVVTDVLPAGLLNPVIAGPTDSTDITGNTVTVGFNSIPIGETRTFTVTVDIDEAATGTVTNPASVASDGTELDLTNNSDDAVTTLTPDFDVVVTKSVDNATPGPNDTIVYTVGLTNAGPSTAPGVLLTDTIPAGLTFVSGTLDGQDGTSDGTNVAFPAMTMAAGATSTAALTFTVDTSSTGTITNTASIPDLSAAGENDTTNNSATSDITVIPVVDLEISKVVSLQDAQVGSNLTYTIVVTNNGPSQAINVQVADTLPSGIDFVSGTGPNSEPLTAVGGVVNVDGGNLDSTGSFTFTIDGVVAPSATGDEVNTVVVSSDTNESDTANNTATAATTIDPLTSTIGGSVYLDSNNNGIREPGEAAIAGVQIVMSGTDLLGSTVDITATTDSNGNYLFSSLSQGTYNVTQIQPSGFRDGITTAGTGAPATTTSNMFSQLLLSSDSDAINFNFGELMEPLSKRRFLAST